MPTTSQLQHALGRDGEKGSLAGILFAVFIKYGMAPLVCILFAFWIQEKDKQLDKRFDAEVVMVQKVVEAIAANTIALGDMRHSIEGVRDEIRMSRYDRHP